VAALAARAGGGVVEAPGDTATATVYADWLEEVGRLDEARALRREVV
jgi:uncharacterized protein (TIGR02996 family)